MFLGSINYSVISLEYFLVFLPVSIQCVEMLISIFLLTSLQFGSNPNWFHMYRDSSILHPEGHVTYSIFWRSIMAARETIEKGSRWIVGNGRKVDIWKDRWLPTPDSLKVISPQRQNLNLEKVAQLIDSETGTWKAGLVKETFIPHEADAILSIPISPKLPEYSLIWACSKNGLFTVRSAYGVTLKLLKETSTTREQGDCSDKSKATEFWKSIWKLNCPNKIKHFLWRVCKNILPTNFHLASRKVIADGGCGFCGECESLGHILWDCKVASDVW